MLPCRYFFLLTLRLWKQLTGVFWVRFEAFLVALRSWLPGVKELGPLLCLALVALQGLQTPDWLWIQGAKVLTEKFVITRFAILFGLGSDRILARFEAKQIDQGATCIDVITNRI